MDAPDLTELRASLTRVRRLQELCRGDNGFTSLLFINGCDGNENISSCNVLKWLFLGCSGKALSWGDSTPYMGEGDVFDALEETFFILTRDSIFLFHVPLAAPILGRHLNFWASGEVGLQVATEISDNGKVFYFRKWINELLSPDSTIGIPCSHESSSLTQFEHWPLVSSFAVDKSFGLLRTSGFLTMRHKTIDATPIVEGLLRSVDALSVRDCLRGAFGPLHEHWRLTVREMSQRLSHQAKGEHSTPETACVEQLQFLWDFNFGGDVTGVATSSSDGVGGDGSDGAWARSGYVHKGPWALVGLRSELLCEDFSEPSGSAGPLDLGAKHVIVEGCEPGGGATVCRTIFLSTGKLGLDETLETGKNDCGILLDMYSRLVTAVHSGIEDWNMRGCENDVDKADKGALSIEKYLRQQIAKIMDEDAAETNKAPNKIQVRCIFFDSLGFEVFGGSSPEMCASFVYIRASVHGLRGPDGELLGAVAVGDTYVATISRSATVASTEFRVDSNCSKNSKFGKVRLLTGECCVPYHTACVGLVNKFDTNVNSELSRALRSHHALQEDLKLGRLLANLGGNQTTLLLNTKPILWNHASGMLKLFEQGFVFVAPGLAPIIISFSRNVQECKLVDGFDESLILVVDLIYENQSKEVNGKASLEMWASLSNILPGADKVSCVGLIMQQQSSVRQAVMGALPGWRQAGVAQNVIFQQNKDISALSEEMLRTARDVGRVNTVIEQELLAWCSLRDAESVLAVVNSRSQRSSSSQQSENIDKPRVAVLLGMPGSGVIDIAKTIVNLCPDDVSISLVLSVVTSEKDALEAVESLDAAHRAVVGKDKISIKRSQLLFVAVSDISAVQLCTLIESESLLTIGSLTTCTSSHVIFEDTYRSGYREIRPKLLQQCSSKPIAHTIPQEYLTTIFSDYRKCVHFLCFKMAGQAL